MNISTKITQTNVVANAKRQGYEVALIKTPKSLKRFAKVYETATTPVSDTTTVSEYKEIVAAQEKMMDFYAQAAVLYLNDKTEISIEMHHQGGYIIHANFNDNYMNGNVVIYMYVYGEVSRGSTDPSKIFKVSKNKLRQLYLK